MDLDFLTEEVKKLARETGEFLKKERLSFDRSRVEQKAAHDYVSYVDKASEKRIVERLHELLPEAGFIAEEGSVRWKNRNTVGWWTPWTGRAIIFTTVRRIA